MDAATGDLLHGNGKKPPPPPRRRCSRYCNTTTLTLLMFLLTNTVSIIVSSGAGPSLLRRPSTIRLWDTSAALLADLNATQSDLAASRAELAGLHARVGTANELLRTLLDSASVAASVPDGWKRDLAGELKLAVTGDEAAVLGHACVHVQDELERYMAYKPGEVCPSDEALAHRLMLAGCEPLPRRRCRAPSPARYPQPTPLPASLWTMPKDTSVIWDAYHCKNYSCLSATSSINGGGVFDLRRVKARWARDDGKLSYSIASVLASRPNGTVRVGLDLAGNEDGGTFAARMLERGVTVVTAAVSAAAPVNSFVASQGLVSVHVTAGHRLPFFDRTLDIVHAAGELELGGGGSMASGGVKLEFALFDVYRVLRPGGLFWLDHFSCAGGQLNATLTPMIGRVGFKKLRRNTGRGKGKEKDQWFVSALLEKPMS
ncbi:hypothetical protein HU200_028442 [Digitaria exilis]|uniref:Methyltransferase type 11 domain-containing protein n=1 Tax=Digitaria exilis TaxID=1010633 RepID=A0A835C341_9POAL|nr:hypothetical protein HU200_028442 [Digitaria exilis]CAB3481907.1 unnamed protein product [Digitaria exilis]